MMFRKALVAALLAGAAWPAIAAAQTAVATPVATTGPAGNEEVIVTAQRRSEKAQNVGIALTPVTGATLRERGVNMINGLQNLTPSLQIENQFGSNQVSFTIRGIGFRDYATNNSATVGVYVDDVAYDLPVMTQGVIYDVNRAEVLRGPQGTLYGRNATGGAVNIITNKPTDDVSAGFTAEYGRFDQFRAEAFVNGQIADGVDARLSATTTQGGAWQHNIRTGEELGDADETAGRLQVKFQTDSKFSLLVNVHGYVDEGEGIGKQLFDTFPGNTIPGSDPVPPVGPYSWRETDWGTSQAYANFVGISTDTKPFRDDHGWGASATANYDFGFANLTYIGAYERLNRHEYNDFDGLQQGYADVYFVSDIKQQSHEARLASEGDGPLSWVTGLFFMEQDLNELYTSGFNGSFGPAFSILEVPYQQKVDTIGIFGQADYAITDQLKLTGGLRWEHEKRNLYNLGTFAPLLFPGLNLANNTTDGTLINRNTSLNQLTGKAELEYTPIDHVMLYASASRGVKSGGFTAYNTFNEAGTDPFRPEKLWAYEAGTKTDWFDNTLRINASIFYYDYRDQQVQSASWVAPTQIGGTPALVGRIVNAPKSDLYGGEIEATWKPIDGLTITQSLGYVRGKFKEFLDADFNVPFGTVDRAGQDIGVPKLTYSGSVEYDGQTNWGFGYAAEADYSYRGAEGFPLLGPLFTVDDYWLVNASLMFHPDDSNFEFGVWGRNIFNQYYATTKNTFNSGAGDNYAIPGEPASYGIRVAFHYN